MERLREMHSPRAWMFLGARRCSLASWLPLVAPDYLVPLLGKFLCFGIAALAMDLVWGYAGILSLGHALFFALGGYGMGMYLMRSIAGEGVYRSELPDFMVFLDWKKLPWYWHGFQSFPFAAVMCLAAPGFLALVFGWFMFRSRIRGVYLSIVTQALTYAATLFFFQNAAGFGGNNGLTDFKRHPGRPLHDPGHAPDALRRLGDRALRDLPALPLRRDQPPRPGGDGGARRRAQEPLLRLRLDQLQALRLDALGGALRAGRRALRAAGRDHQPERDAALELDRDGDLGGGRRSRARCSARVLGAWLVNGGKSWLTAALPSAWLYVLGALFVAVTLFLPDGLVGLSARIKAKLWRAQCETVPDANTRARCPMTSRPPRPSANQPRRRHERAPGDSHGRTTRRSSDADLPPPHPRGGAPVARALGREPVGQLRRLQGARPT